MKLACSKFMYLDFLFPPQPSTITPSPVPASTPWAGTLELNDSLPENRLVHD